MKLLFHKMIENVDICSYWVRNTAKHAWVEATPLDTSSWHHVVLVLKANNGEFTVYHDGESKVTQSLNINDGHGTGSGNVVVPFTSPSLPVSRPLDLLTRTEV